MWSEETDRAFATLVEMGYDPDSYIYTGSDQNAFTFVEKRSRETLIVPRGPPASNLRFQPNSRLTVHQCRSCKACWSGDYTNCPSCGVRLRKRRRKTPGLHPDTKLVLRKVVDEIIEDNYYPVRLVTLPRKERALARRFVIDYADEKGLRLAISFSPKSFSRKVEMRIAKSYKW